MEQTTYKTNKMNHIKNFLGLIEEGNAVTILSQENVVERLNELFKYDLIVFKDGEIFLSEKGKEFRREDIAHPLIYSDSCETEFL